MSLHFKSVARHRYRTPVHARRPFSKFEEDDDSTSLDYAYSEPGAVPGTLDIETDASPPVIEVIDYSSTSALRKQVEAPEACIPYIEAEDTITWIDVQGLGSEDILQRLGQVFHLHPLVLEDIVNVPQRPKFEEYQDQVLYIARMVTPTGSGTGFFSEQVSLIWGKTYLLTVQEEAEYDCLEPVRSRLHLAKGTIRNQGTDYLAYALIDAIIDGFFPVLEDYGEMLEELEDEVVANPNQQTLQKIHDIKRGLLTLRRTIWPQRDAINSLIRDSGDLVSPEVRLYLRDCYDHAVQVLDMVETYREVASSLMDVYLSSVSNRMNEVMKVLTVVSSVFIPLTFIAGVYGMNFDPGRSPLNMPELEWYWGYPVCLGVMGAIALLQIFYFKQRGWFENFSTRGDRSADRGY